MICPYLGSLGDRNIRLKYPSYQNQCYATGESAAAEKGCQERFCLAGSYQQCERYGESIAEAPSARRVPKKESGGNWKYKLLLSVVVFLLGLGLLSLFAVFALNRSSEIFAAFLAVTDTPTATATWTPTLTASPTATATTTATATHTLTSVPTATPVPLTITPTETPTTSPTETPIPTDTPVPTNTPMPTNTPVPPTPVPQPQLPQAQQPPDRLVIPSINVDTKVLPMGWVTKFVNGQKVTEWQVIDYAAGWHKNSAVPGNGGNVVISGHNNIRGKVFKELYALEEGADVFLYADGHEYHYRVVENLLFLDNYTVPLEQRVANNKFIEPMDDERLTLVSCWPYDTRGLGYTTHRVVVITKPVND